MQRLLFRMVGAFLVGTGSALAGREDTDFDGDGLSDNAVYHSRKGDWYIRRSHDGQARLQNWGWSQTQPVSGDFDGDGKADLCVYNGRGGLWYVLRSSDGQQVTTAGWGAHDKDPVVGDFDGDGQNDLSMYHPPSGDWSVLRSSDGQRVTKNWGNSETEPVPGDYDGDGKTDYAIFHRSAGNWFIWPSFSGTPYVQNWGFSETEPVQADYDGDGKTDIAVFNSTSGQWFIRQSSNGGQLRLFNSGWVNVQPVPGYYDNDNKADPAVYHMQKGNWLMLFSTDGQKHLQNWGWLEAEPSSSAYRVDDDNKHYGFSFGHDYDDDAFQASGKYPRTGTLAQSPPATGAGSSPNPPSSSGDVALLKAMKWYHGPKIAAGASVNMSLDAVSYKTRYKMLWMTFGPAYTSTMNQLGIIQHVPSENRYCGGIFDGVKYGNRAKVLSNINGGPPASSGGNYLRPYVVDFNRKTGYFLMSKDGSKISRIHWVK